MNMDTYICSIVIISSGSLIPRSCGRREMFLSSHTAWV